MLSIWPPPVHTITPDAPERFGQARTWHDLHPEDIHRFIDALSPAVQRDPTLLHLALSSPDVLHASADLMGVSGAWLAGQAAPIPAPVTFTSFDDLAHAMMTFGDPHPALRGLSAEQQWPLSGAVDQVDIWLSPARRPSQFLLTETVTFEAGGPRDHPTRLLRFMSDSRAEHWVDLFGLVAAGWASRDARRLSAQEWDAVTGGTLHPALLTGVAAQLPDRPHRRSRLRLIPRAMHQHLAGQIRGAYIEWD